MGRPRKIIVKDAQSEEENEEYTVEKILGRRLVNLSVLIVQFDSLLISNLPDSEGIKK